MKGRRLVLPDESFFQQISPEKASEVLSEHVRYFQFGITGRLPVPTLDEMRRDPEVFNRPSDILEQQKSQTEKIDKLQQESNELKKQLEILLNEKNDRDQRLIDLEKSLKNTLNLDKTFSNSSRALKEQKLLEPSPSLQKKPSSNSNKVGQGLIKTVQEKKKMLSPQESAGVLEGDILENNEVNTLNDTSEPRLLDSTSRYLSKLIWALPLMFFGLILLFFIRRKKKEVQNDAVMTNEAGYIETAENAFFDLQETDEELEESSLDTSIKLDVARAYIEAEDTESALDILTEIMEEGSDEQRQQAHDLLAVIPSR